MNDALIQLEDMSVGYGGNAVLAGLSLKIRRGSFTALLGANGSGKSTLFKTLLGLIPPLRGRMTVGTVDGRPATFGFVPQQEAFDPVYMFSAFEVALMGVYGRIGAGHFVPAAEKERVRECLRATGADEFAKRPFAELSGGQKQRVLIARALATQPDALLLDEPTAGVDLAATQVVMSLVNRLHREQGFTVILVTHDLHIVREHAEHVIWLHQGEERVGTVAELLSPSRLAEIMEMEFR